MSAAARPQAPTFSVIVAVHDVAGHVEGCIASLRAQSRSDFEAIVVDDGATDGSGELARAAARGDARFRFIEQENRGLGAARNAGLEAARGEFIAFLDGDDRFAPEYLERLHAALEETGADWAACAIRLVHPDGETVHSAIHGAPALPEDTTPRLLPLDDWREVIRLFPSAWNKLYRRALINGLRFDAGWYEDHTFFQRAAARTQTIAWLPVPLHLHTRGRAGQITSADSERVFEQIAVLERCAGIIAASDKAGGRAGLARLATRLMHERAGIVRDPDRRARFAAACRDFLARHGIAYTPGWDDDISRSWGLVVSARWPLSVIIPTNGDAEMLTRTLEALAAQYMPDFELLVVADAALAPAARTVIETVIADAAPAGARLLLQPGQGVGAARNHGFDAARGEFVVFLDAGDRVYPYTFAWWVESMLRTRADFGFSRFRIGLDADTIHNGFHDLRGRDAAELESGLLALEAADTPCLHALVSAKIFRRALLAERGIRFDTGPLPAWIVTLRAALEAPRIQYFATADVEIGEDPRARQLWRARDLARAIGRMARALPADAAARLPEGWRRRLFARAVWEKLHFADFPDARARARFARGAAWVARLHRLGGARTPLDPYIDAEVATLLGAPADGLPARL